MSEDNLWESSGSFTLQVVPPEQSSTLQGTFAFFLFWGCVCHRVLLPPFGRWDQSDLYRCSQLLNPSPGSFLDLRLCCPFMLGEGRLLSSQHYPASQ